MLVVKPHFATDYGLMHRWCPSVCLYDRPSDRPSVAKMQKGMVSIDDLQVIVHRLFKELSVGTLKSKMAEIRHLENDVIFLALFVSDTLVIICRTV